jgi:hypothetical protein
VERRARARGGRGHVGLGKDSEAGERTEAPWGRPAPSVNSCFLILSRGSHLGGCNPVTVLYANFTPLHESSRETTAQEVSALSFYCKFTPLVQPPATSTFLLKQTSH